jgi:hypothetical protein
MGQAKLRGNLSARSSSPNGKNNTTKKGHVTKGRYIKEVIENKWQAVDRMRKEHIANVKRIAREAELKKASLANNEK